MTDGRAGKVILLNGGSSAGKTTTARMLQQLRPAPTQYIALDQFRDGLPDRYRGLNSPAGAPGSLGLNVVPVPLGDGRGTDIRFGPVGRRMLAGMRRAVAAFARDGGDVVVDDLLLEPSFLADYVDALAGIEVLFVGVRCDLDTVERRESGRPGRFPGTAAVHHARVHEGCVYDVEVDTGRMSPRECAEAILAAEREPPAPTAFERLRGA